MCYRYFSDQRVGSTCKSFLLQCNENWLDFFVTLSYQESKHWKTDSVILYKITFLLIFDDKYVLRLVMKLLVKPSFFSADISIFRERAGEPQNSRWPEKSWRLLSSVWSIWCPSTSLATSCSTTAQFRTLKKQWVDQGWWQLPSVCFHVRSVQRFYPVFLFSFSIEPCKSSIYPFQELKRPLQFLGLYDTTLCNVTHIPAYKVMPMALV